jgi:uncharacterized membrane protein
MPNKKIVLIVCFFAIVFGLITFVNHYFFRTHALDLGLYSNVSYQYSKGILATSEMIKPVVEPQWAIHFDLYLLFFSPFVALFGSYTLLVIQWLAVLLGGIGVYKYIKFSFPLNGRLPYLSLIYFFLFFGVYSAFGYDYHSIVLASALLPWFFLFLKQDKHLWSILLFAVMLMSQENMSLFLCFVSIGLMIEYRKNKGKVLFLGTLSFFALVYFNVVVQYLIPSFALTHTYPGFCFSILGATPKEAIIQLLSHPIDAIKVLFTNHTDHAHGDYVKLETHLSLLFSGVFLLIFRPAFLVMLLPIYGQKFFHDNYVMWSIDAQYSIEFAPILAIGIFTFIGYFKEQKIQNGLSLLVVLFALATTIRIFDNTIFFTSKSKLRIYQNEHYTRDYDVAKVNKVLQSIPTTSKVCAHSPFVPHLIFHAKIYMFPFVKDADVILLSTKEETYPLTKVKFERYLDSLKQSNQWKHSVYEDHLWLFEKKK